MCLYSGVKRIAKQVRVVSRFKREKNEFLDGNEKVIFYIHNKLKSLLLGWVVVSRQGYHFFSFFDGEGVYIGKTDFYCRSSDHIYLKKSQ